MTFDGIAFFHEFRIPYTLDSPNVSRGWVGLKCPFCGDRSDHMGFNLSVGCFSCWKCGKKGTIDTISRLLNVPKIDATRIYAQYLVRKSISNPDTGKPRRKGNASQIILPMAEFTKLERAYLKKRWLWDVWEQYDLRSGGITGEWAFRIVIPIKLNGVIVSATGRYIVDGTDALRYKSLSTEREVVHHKHTFLNIDSCEDTVIVVEGPIDAIRGGPSFVSGFGMVLTEEQLGVLSKFSHIIFMFDNEDAAQEQAKKYGMILSQISNAVVEVARLDGGYKDLGEMPPEEVEKVRKEIGV